MPNEKKTVTMIAEGTPREWPKRNITYAEVVTLEVPDCPQHLEITYSARHKNGHANKPGGFWPLVHPSKSSKGWFSMFQKLVSHNDEIKCLVEKGYTVAFDVNYLIICNILCLDEPLQLQTGAIATKLVIIHRERITQDDQVKLYGRANGPLRKSQLTATKRKNADKHTASHLKKVF